MEFLGQVEVSGGGRPILDPNEVEVCVPAETQESVKEWGLHRPPSFQPAVHMTRLESA